MPVSVSSPVTVKRHSFFADTVWEDVQGLKVSVVIASYGE